MDKTSLEKILIGYGVQFTDALSDRLIKEFKSENELLNDVANIVKWTEEGIKYNTLEFRERVMYESYAYGIIKNKIAESKGE